MLPRRVSLLLLAFAFLGFLSGCQTVSYFDSITYQNLTSLKGEMRVKFSEFSQTGATLENDYKFFEDFKINIARAVEYEKGKSLNDDTIAQMEIIEENIDEVIERFKNEGKLSPGYCAAKWKIFASAFDIAIQSERLKIEKN